MATAYKTAQVQGTSSTGTYATLYSTPSSTEAVVSSISICNTAANNATYRIAIMGSAGTPGASEWIVYDSVVPANETIFLTVGVTLSASRFIRVSSSANTVAFSAFISEIS
jgi:hypothetical protein